MSKFDSQNKILNVRFNIWPEFKCQNSIFGPSSNVKIGFLNVKIRYSVQVRMSK